VKRLSLELGGHCPLIVCEDADLKAAVKGGVYRSFRNMGQICNAINRIYVHETIFQPFVDEFVKKTAALTIGDGLENPDVDLGPMTTESGRQKVREHIQDAVSKGAKILYGGKEPSGQEFERGLFFEPTVLVDVNHEMKVMREETFGPVAPIMAVTSLDEAIEYANDSPYGLVAYVYTKDLVKAITAAERLEYGTVGINNVSGGEVSFPYGGWKESGIGVENSSHAVEEYLQLKHIRIAIG
jgi:succinate-semialdehyde dehydrogenase/glutarate-semialdehyde dehydrogenase